MIVSQTYAFIALTFLTPIRMIPKYRWFFFN